MQYAIEQENNMSGDQLSTYRFQEEYINELRAIDTEINDLNKNRNNSNITQYNNTKMNIIRKLDNTERKIMQRKWDSNSTRKRLRPLVNKLYEKLKYCAPIRTKQQYVSLEYTDPEQNNNREDLTKCPNEEFTDTDLYLYEPRRFPKLNVPKPKLSVLSNVLKKRSKPVIEQSTVESMTLPDVKIDIVYINSSEADKLQKYIEKKYIENKGSDLNISINKIDATDAYTSSIFKNTDYVIFQFPKSIININILNKSKVELMIGVLIELNETGKCLVLNYQILHSWNILHINLMVM